MRRGEKETEKRRGGEEGMEDEERREGDRREEEEKGEDILKILEQFVHCTNMAASTALDPLPL